MILSLIVAADENNCIGGGNKLLWHLPDDLKRFKELTRGHPVIMGRKTYESIGHALPERQNIVISRQKNFSAPDVSVVPSLNAAIVEAGDAEEVFVIGGGEIYQQAIEKANRIYMTRVHSQFDGDVFFPAMDQTAWKETAKIEHLADDKHVYTFTFVTYER